jgi:hypothetical protein
MILMWGLQEVVANGNTEVIGILGGTQCFAMNVIPVCHLYTLLSLVMWTFVGAEVN